jgi:hypothetical protein
MARATAESLTEVNGKRRPFLYTRSSFLGTGAFSGKEKESGFRERERVGREEE